VKKPSLHIYTRACLNSTVFAYSQFLHLTDGGWKKAAYAFFHPPSVRCDFSAPITCLSQGLRMTLSSLQDPLKQVNLSRKSFTTTKQEIFLTGMQRAKYGRVPWCCIAPLFRDGASEYSRRPAPSRYRLGGWDHSQFSDVGGEYAP